MPKFRSLEVLAAIATAAAISAPRLPAQAHSLTAGPSTETHIVSSSVQTPVTFSALPGARCLIGTSPSRTLTVYADDAGIVRFHAQPGRGAAPALRLIAACDAGNREMTIPLTLRAVSGSVAPAQRPVVSASAATPRGFNPASASDGELDRYGYPPRPNQFSDPGAYSAWLQAATLGRSYVAPTGILRSDRMHGPAARIDGSATSYNWSGMVAKGSTGQFNHVVGKWVVPLVASDENHVPAYSSIWAGLDGYNSSDIIQDGSEQDVVDVLGWLVTSYFVWIEYYPDSGATELSNFALNPGDQVYMSAKPCYNKNNQLLGCFFLVDETQGERTSAMERPPNAHFAGNNAEWILERPTVSGRLWYLPAYAIAETTDMIAYDTTQQRFVSYGNESYDSIDMHGRISGHLLSKSTYLTKSTAGLMWENFN